MCLYNIILYNRIVERNFNDTYKADFFELTERKKVANLQKPM